jgi:hypothetical protein
MTPPSRPACTSTDPASQGGNSEGWCLLHSPADSHDCTTSRQYDSSVHQLRNHAACSTHCIGSKADCSHLEGNAEAPARRSYSTGSHHSLRIDPSPRMSSDQLLLKAERAVSLRLLPPLLFLVIISYLDRTALSFASIQMSQDLNLSSSIYGLGSGRVVKANREARVRHPFRKAWAALTPIQCQRTRCTVALATTHLSICIHWCDIIQPVQCKACHLDGPSSASLLQAPSSLRMLPARYPATSCC